MSDRVKQALCCVCGTVRTCRRPRNHRRENYWLRYPLDRDWHRETGELKCAECGRITTHAIINGDNHAELIQRAALDRDFTPLPRDQLGALRVAYRQGLPRNPNLSHLWWVSDEKAAREAGASEVATLCGGTEHLRPVGARISSPLPADYLAPEPVRDDEYEDPDTGLSWRDSDCVDCLRVFNRRHLQRRRYLVGDWLDWIRRNRLDSLDADAAEKLLDTFKAVFL